MLGRLVAFLSKSQRIRPGTKPGENEIAVVLGFDLFGKRHVTGELDDNLQVSYRLPLLIDDLAPHRARPLRLHRGTPKEGRWPSRASDMKNSSW